ncbi:MAG: tetratricopeptide repeat protein, partial [Desulfovibrionaceae bacterium]
MEYPSILGVYSLQLDTNIGDGGTTKKHANVTYWYVRQLSEEEFEVQPLNRHHVPSGVRSRLSRLDFLRQYGPEPAYYARHTLPAMETLRRKLAMGAEAFAKGDLDEAERQLVKALMVDDRNVDANYQLGEVYSEQKDFAKLKKVLDTLLGIPEAFTFEYRQQFNTFGISLRKNGHFDESIRYYKKSLEIIDSDENVYFNLARVYYEKGKMEDCIAALRRALELNPGFVEAQKFLHWC